MFIDGYSVTLLNSLSDANSSREKRVQGEQHMFLSAFLFVMKALSMFLNITPVFLDKP